MRPTLLAATLTLLAPLARAEDAQSELDQYVHREYLANGFFTGVGAVGVVTGAVLLYRVDALEHAAGYPVTIIGGVQLVVGAVYLATTPDLRARRTRQLASDPAAYRREEGARIDAIVRAFPWFLGADAAVVVAGGVALGVGVSGGDRTVTGVGVGCLAAGAIELALDAGAYWIARQHRDGVRALGLSAGPGYVGVAGAF